MRNPAISIVMPVINGEKYLNEAIQSIRNQTFQDFEVICVDDGSCHDLTEGLHRIVAEDPRFAICHHQYNGAGAARNYGFHQVRGEYVAFLDSDNLLSEGFLECLHGIIKKHSADIAACGYSVVRSDGQITKRDGVHSKWIPQGLDAFCYRDCPDYIMRVIDPLASNKLYRTEFIRTHGFMYDEISSIDDITFSAVASAAAERITYTADALLQLRLGADDGVAGNEIEKLKNVSKAINSTVKQASRLPYSEVIRNAILSFEVDNYILALSEYIKDFSDPAAGEFYQTVHERFNDPDLAEITSKTLNNPKRFRHFCTVKKHDYQAMKLLKSRRLVVSLTTYPKRIGMIPKVLSSIYRQPNKKADEVVLWLAQEQFPEKEKELPGELLKLVEDGSLTIRWCDDLKPHKKYFYALQEYSDDLVVTIDDDLWYTWNTLETLYESYLLYPQAVSTVRAHLILFDENNQIMPYGRWIQETDACIYKPSMQLMATGGAGVLYPPKLFRKEFFDSKAIMDNCLWADDLWLKAMQVVSDVPVVVARPHEQLQYLPGTQEEALYHVNVWQNQNDVQLANIIRWLDDVFEPGILVRKMTENTDGERILGMQAVSRHLDEERKAVRRQVEHSRQKAREAENKQRQTEEKLRAANDQLRQIEELQKQTQQKLSLTEETLNRTRQMLQYTETDLKQTQQKLTQTEDDLKQTGKTLHRTEEKLAHTGEQLRWTREHMPISVQMLDLGDFLRQQKQGSNPLLWGIKYGIYLCGWVPLKLLTGTMYCLKNGFKAAAKRVFGKIFRRG